MNLQSLFAQTASDKESRIEKITQIFYLKPEMRSPYDKIQIEGSQLNLQVWKDLPSDPQADKVECSGYQWLLTGRGQKMGQGAQQVFANFAEIQSIQLEFVELAFQSKRVDGKGRLQKEIKPKIYLKLWMDRSTSAAQGAVTKESLRDSAQCLKVGRSIVSKREVTL